MQNWIRRHISVCGALAALVLCGSAAAAPASEGRDMFLACDGFPAPTKKADGMTAGSVWGLFTYPDPEQGEVAERRALGPQYVGDCTWTLQSPMLAPQQWMRRVSLLRARAIHKLAGGDLSGAKADLDLAETAGRDDPYYRHSLKVGIDLLRAYVLSREGDVEGARVMAEQAVAARPNDRQTLASATVAIGADPRLEAELDTLIDRLARVDPRFVDVVYERAFARHDFARVVALFPGFALTPPSKALPEAYGGADVTRPARYGYALAALGRAGEARQAIKAMRASFDAATLPLPPLPPLAQGSTAEAAAYHRAKEREWRNENDNRAYLRGRYGPMVDYAASLVEDRIRVADGEGVEVLAERKSTHSSDPILADLRAAAAGGPAPVFHTGELLAGMGLRADNELSVLVGWMPPPEGPELVGRYNRSFSQVGPAGWFARKPKPGEAVPVSYSTPTDAPSAISDMALLSAANEALKEGKPGFIVLGRKDIKKMVTVVTNGIPSSPTFAGYMTELVILPIDPARMTPAQAGSAWRVVDARAVVDELGPFYAPSRSKKAKS